MSQTLLEMTKDLILAQIQAQKLSPDETINTEWGSGTIRYAAVGLRPGWLMRCARRSPRYTTRWEELAVVR